jgi:hypothetical protein
VKLDDRRSPEVGDTEVGCHAGGILIEQADNVREVAEQLSGAGGEGRWQFPDRGASVRVVAGSDGGNDVAEAALDPDRLDLEGWLAGDDRVERLEPAEVHVEDAGPLQVADEQDAERGVRLGDITLPLVVLVALVVGNGDGVALSRRAGRPASLLLRKAMTRQSGHSRRLCMLMDPVCPAPPSTPYMENSRSSLARSLRHQVESSG